MERFANVSFISILWVYIIFNVFAALFVYWLVRVPKKKFAKKKKD